MRKRVTMPERTRMRDMRKRGYSLSEIGKVCGRDDITVLNHVRDIPPPEGGWKRGGRPIIHGRYAQKKDQV